jgi:hypothetical protein
MLNGVKVAQMFLVHLVMVRIHIQLQKRFRWLYMYIHLNNERKWESLKKDIH